MMYIMDAVTGEKIGELADIPDFIPILGAEPEVCCVGVDLAASADFTASFTVEVDRLKLLEIVTGKRFANNYFKYHGGVLVRRAYKKRRRCK